MGRKDGRRGSLRRVTITPPSLEVVKESNRRPRYFPDDEPTGKRKMPMERARVSQPVKNRDDEHSWIVFERERERARYRLTYGRLLSCN